METPAVSAATVDADVAAAVGRELEALLGARVAACRSLDRRFADEVAERVARFTLTGGKRLRSRFLWWAFRGHGGGDGAPAAAALRLAAALELLQTCALVQDDVMDDSALRRGRPALHTAFGGRAGFGASAAVLAGDVALAWADDTVAAARLTRDARAAVTGMWARLRDEMAAGQYLDLCGQAGRAPSAAAAARVARLKTALYTVERPLLLGAALAGRPARTLRELRLAGRCAGLAFQFRDDLLGLFGDPAGTGKPVGGDVREGRATYPLAVALAQAGDDDAGRLLRAHVGVPVHDGPTVRQIVAAVESSGARDRVTATVERLVAHGLTRLASARMAEGPEEMLREMFRGVALPATGGVAA